MHQHDRVIWRMFNIRRGDNLPYTPYRSKKTRNDFGALFAQLGFVEGVEVGVSRAVYSTLLLDTTPGLHLTCVDPWCVYDGANESMAANNYNTACEKLKSRNATIIHKPSCEAAPLVDDGSQDFVYIDGSHRFDDVMLDILLWAPKVKKGGILAGHDYFHFRNSGVVRAVDAYTMAHHIDPWYVTRESMPSWFWVVR